MSDPDPNAEPECIPFPVPLGQRVQVTAVPVLQHCMKQDSAGLHRAQDVS
jgi:hypothetical protein